MTPRLLAGLTLALTVAATEARASCLEDLCFCTAAAPRVVSGHITGLVAEGGATVQVDNWIGVAAEDGGGLGSSLVINAEADDAVGRRVLVGYSVDGVPVGRVDVGADGTTVCRSQHFTVAASSAALVTGEGSLCVSALVSDGLAPQVCNDTPSSGCSTGAGLGLGLLAVLGLRRRRA